MTPPDFLIALFYAVDQERLEVPKHPDATLSPSAVVTLALLQAIKGGGTRAFSYWLRRFLAAPTVRGVAGTDGMELIHGLCHRQCPRHTFSAPDCPV